MDDHLWGGMFTYGFSWNLAQRQDQEEQGLGALLDKMEDNDHIKLDNNHNIEI